MVNPVTDEPIGNGLGKGTRSHFIRFASSTSPHPTPLFADTVVSIDVVDVQTPPGAGQRLVLTGAGEVAAGEVLGMQPVVENSVAVLTLDYTAYAVALEVRGTVRVNCDATIARLWVADGGS